MIRTHIFFSFFLFLNVLLHAQNNPTDQMNNPYSNHPNLSPEEAYQNETDFPVFYTEDFDDMLIINRYDGVMKSYNYNFESQWTFKPNTTKKLIIGENAFYYKDGVIFTAFYQGHVFALNAADGEPFWNGKIGDGELIIRRQDLKPYQNKLFIASRNSNVYGLDASTGDFSWSYKLDYPHNLYPIVPLNGILYIPNAPYVYNMVADIGKVLIARGFKEAMYGKPVTDGNLIIIPNTKQTVYGLEPSRMEPIWEKELAGTVESRILMHKGKLYTATKAPWREENGTVYEMDPKDGKILREITMPSSVEYITAIDDFLYGYTKEKLLFALATNEAKNPQFLALKHQPISNLQLHKGALYFYAKEGLIRVNQNLAKKTEEIIIPYDGPEEEFREYFTQIEFTN